MVLMVLVVVMPTVVAVCLVEVVVVADVPLIPHTTLMLLLTSWICVFC